MSRYCFIPARSGSKGLKNKNMLFLFGKHVVEYSIINAIESNLFSNKKIIVTTDSQEYIDILSRKYDIEFDLRPQEFSGDSSTTFDLINYLLGKYKDVTSFSLIQPTSPFRETNQLREAYNLFETSDYKSVVAFMESKKSSRLFTKLNNGLIMDNCYVDTGYARQKMEKEYVPTGSFFISSKKDYLREMSFFTDRTFAFVTEGISNIDVDDEEDFRNILGQIHFNKKVRYDFVEDNLSFNIQGEGDFLYIGDSRSSGLSAFPFTQMIIEHGLTLRKILPYVSNNCRDFEKITINLGINDLTFENVQCVLDVFKEIIQICISNGVQINIILPIETSYWFDFDNTSIDELKNGLELMTTNSNNVLIFDLRDSFSYSLSSKPWYFVDGVHFSNDFKKKYFGLITSIMESKDIVLIERI